MTRISTPTKWHGGKHYLAPKLIELFPEHTHYVEPFFGGGSVLLSKPPQWVEGHSEVANDLHGDLINFWDVLRSDLAFEAFCRKCEATPFSQDAYKLACASLSSTAVVLPSERAWAFFIRCRQSLAGRMDAFAPLSKSRTRRGMNEQASAWLNAVEGLPAVHERIKRVVILNDDALKVIKREDSPHTFFYLDPPYLHETRATTGEYQHEMTTEQHAKLLMVISEIKGKFMLSGYPSVLYNSFAKARGWRTVDFDLPNNAASGKSKGRETECVWMNYERAGVG